MCIRDRYQSVRDKLSVDIIIKQTVSLPPEIVLEENTDIEAWDAVIENNDALLEKYIAGEPISQEKLAREEQRRVQEASLFPVYHGSAKKGLGIQPLMDAVTGLFQPIGEQGSATLCGSVFKVEYLSLIHIYLPDCRRHPLYALSDENKKIWHDYHYGHFDGPCHAFDWYGILEPYYRSNCRTFG